MLGPVLYIALLIPTIIFVVKAFTTPSYTVYHFPPQLGYIAWFIYYAVPGPFISLATLPKYLQLIQRIHALQLQRQ